jgi:hypothetical protein
MPTVVIKSGETRADGQEESLTDYLCDWPDCGNVAVHVLGAVRELGMMAAVCEEHVPTHPAQPPRAGD